MAIIRLGEKPQPANTIFLGGRPKSKLQLSMEEANRKQRIADISLKVAGIAALGLIPGGALVKGARAVGKFLIPKTVKGVATAVVGAGVLASSKRARKAVVEAPKTLFTGGQKLGKIIDEPGKAEDILGIRKKKTIPEKIIEGAKVAGIGGAIVAGVVGASKLIKDKKPTLTPQLAGLKDVGITDPKPAKLAVPGLVPIQPAPMGRPGAPVTQQPTKPVTNIIQIQVS